MLAKAHSLHRISQIYNFSAIQKMDEQQQKPKPQPAPYRSTKFFISSLNTHLGHALVERLQNQAEHPQNPNWIVGTTISKAPQQQFDYVPQGVRKTVESEKTQFFQDVILNSDTIIYDLNTCDLSEVETVISCLKINQFKENKTLICVSNVMTWAKSKPKEKKEGDEEEGDENPVEEPDSEEEGEPPADEEQEKKTYVRFTEKDYNLRRPHPDYEKIKSIETLCIAAGSTKPNLKTYVICSGILYGAGEKVLRPYFMQAMLQQPESLSVYGKGKNRIPMIHLMDLVSYIEKTIEKKPAIPYMLALDHNPKPTQKKIIESISKGIGTGKVASLPVDPSVKNIDILTLNLRMKPTMYFAKLEEQDAAIEAEEGVQVTRFKFNWSAKEGVQKNVQKLRQQFNRASNLSQEKIFINGPPGCGKTHYASKLSEKYYLPHLHIKKVIAEVMALQNEFGEEVRNAYAEKKQAEIATKQQEYDTAKEKWKKIPKDLREPLESFDPQKVDVRLSDEIIFKCYKWRLEQNDCLNRGYILDGYPKKYEEAKEIFMGLPPPAEGEEEPDQNAKKILDQRLAPTKFILLQQSDRQILEQLQRLPEDVVEGTHFTEKEAKRRLKIYRNLMNGETGDCILTDFFEENKIPCFTIKTSNQTSHHLESIVKAIETEQQQQSQNVMGMVSDGRNKKSNLREEMIRKTEIIRNIQGEDYRMKKQNEQNEEREILDKKSLALRKYLDVNLVPILSEGILEILKQYPADPVDRLAQFLFKNSLKVPNPDPSTFEF